MRASWVLVAMPLVLAACGGIVDAPSPLPPEQAAFVFRVHGRPPTEEFRIVSSSPAFVAEARAQLALPEAARKRFPSGPIAAGNGGVNLSWGWHFEDASFTDATIELCDGSPSLVQVNLDYWLNTVKRFCPWGGYVYVER